MVAICPPKFVHFHLVNVFVRPPGAGAGSVQSCWVQHLPPFLPAVGVLLLLLVLLEVEAEEEEFLSRGLSGPGYWVRGGCPWLSVGNVGW